MKDYSSVPSNENRELEDGRCELCGRRVGERNLTEHHLLPRSVARMMKRRKKARQELKRRDPGRIVSVCRPCHRNIHASIENKELDRSYDSLRLLRSHRNIRRFTAWIKDRPDGAT